ncbi:MAG: hypothetical protein PHI48_02190 [Bacteroidales bacterium]|nr:hypothetical protein [Bacteroidales bacterium]
MKTVHNKRIFPLLLITVLFITRINGWSNSLPDDSDTENNQISLGQRITGMATLMRDNYQEKIYIQTDRPIYNLNDTIWYKVWVMQAGTLLPTEKSRLVYVDLINEKDSVTQKAQYNLKGGGANGQFVLTKAIQDKGLYRIRAYTRWQKNFGDSAFFEKIIPIWGDKDKEQENKRFVYEGNRFLTQGQYQKQKRKTEEKKLLEAQKRANREFELDVQFLPEGGKLIAGVANRVAYKALFPDGRSVPVEGTIVDQHGNDIVSFTSEHKGMGSFLLLPDTGKQYSARLFNDQLIPLPAVEKEGVTLMVVSKPTSDTLVVAVNGSTGVVSNQTQFTLLAESRGLPTKEAYNIRMNKSRVLLRIPKENLKSGINRLTLFTANGQPLCERLVYIDRKDELKFDVKANWEIKSDTDQMMTLKIRPQMNGTTVQSAFALSVTNKNRVPVDSIQKTFRSEMLLSSDLKGFVETPGYYFNNPYDSICKQLDLLLLTHGWRGYDWDDITRKKFTHLPDTAFTISGKVSNLLGKPVQNRKISLIVQGGKFIYDMTRTDPKGRFAFSNLDVRETSMVRLKIEKEMKKRTTGLGIKFDSIFEKPEFPIVPIEDYLYESEEVESLMLGYQENIEDDKAFMDSLRKQRGINLLPEVTVTERKKIKKSWNKNGSGVADILIDSVQIGQYDAYNNVLDILKAEVPGFVLNSRTLADSDGFYEPRQFDYYNIDGKIVSFQVDAECLTRDPIIFPTEYSWMIYYNETLSRIAGNDVRGIEVLTTKDNLLWYEDIFPTLARYGRIIGVVVVITTRSGKGPRGRIPSTVYYSEIRGGSIPKNFYVPKYYPKDPIDQIDYDKKQVYFWNPTLLTNGEQDVEVSFPVGAYMKGNLQLEIEGTDLNGHIGTQRQQINLNP